MKNRTQLLQQHAGVNSIQDMGTTGLVAYVLSGNANLNRWERFNVAKRVVLGRGLNPLFFARAIISTGERHSIHLGRFAAANCLSPISLQEKK